MSVTCVHPLDLTRPGIAISGVAVVRSQGPCQMHFQVGGSLRVEVMCTGLFIPCKIKDTVRKAFPVLYPLFKSIPNVDREKTAVAALRDSRFRYRSGFEDRMYYGWIPVTIGPANSSNLSFRDSLSAFIGHDAWLTWRSDKER